MIDAGADILFEILPAPSEFSIKASNLDDATKRILKAELQSVNKAVEYSVDKEIEKSRSND